MIVPTVFFQWILQQTTTQLNIRLKLLEDIV